MAIETTVHPHVVQERAELFSAPDGGSTEQEYLELVKALIAVTKPERVLETGSFHGYGTWAICQALVANGRGHFTSLESDPRFVQEARRRLLGYESWGMVWEVESREWLTRQETVPFHFAFFDSGELDVRLEELELCLSLGWLERGATFAIHDTSRLRTCDDTGTRAPLTPVFWERFRWLADVQRISYLEFPLSRGMVVGRIG
jgi:predicted O-methyltransferase YrrM